MFDTGVAIGGIDPTFDYIVSLLAPKAISYTASDYADFAEMKSDFEATGRIKINVNHSDKTIFGSPVTNWQFRAWHDACHILANADFTFEGEKRAASLQATQVLALDGPSLYDKARWIALIVAEVIGQGEFFIQHNDFPANQRAFVAGYLVENYPELLALPEFAPNLANLVVRY